MDEMFAKRVLLPTNRSKMSWDIFICFIYLNSLFDDSFFWVFGMRPVTVPALKVS